MIAMPSRQTGHSQLRRYVRWRIAFPVALFVWLDVAGRSAQWKLGSIEFLKDLGVALIPVAAVFWLSVWVGVHAMSWAGFRMPADDDNPSSGRRDESE